MGLALVYTAVKAHGGELELHSEPGQGTEAILRFPAVPEGQGTEPPPPEGGGEGRALQLMVVDDDAIWSE